MHEFVSMFPPLCYHLMIYLLLIKSDENGDWGEWGEFGACSNTCGCTLVAIFYSSIQMSQAIGENGVCGVLAVTLAATAKCRGLETVTTQGQKGAVQTVQQMVPLALILMIAQQHAVKVFIGFILHSSKQHYQSYSNKQNV